MRYTVDKNIWQKKVLLANEKSESEVYHMKTRKLRLLSALLALAMLLALLPTAAFAEDTVYGTISGAPGGNCGAEGDGSDVKWSFDTTTGTLIISGTGAMKDYTNNLSTRRSTAPWAEEQVAQVVINEGVTRIGNSVFGYCNNLKNIEIPETVTKIGGSAFQGAGLTSIEIPASVTDIGNFAFEGTKLTSIKIPASVTDIRILAFYKCKNLKTVTFADDSQLKKIWTSAFAETPITSIEIPASVTNIGTKAFEQCEQLESVTFAPGSKLETIGENAFNGCDNLQTVYYDGNNDGLKQSLQRQLGEKFKNDWTVKFETEGGSEVAQQNVKNGQTATKPTDPTKEGYKFGGWYDGDTKFDFDTPITKDTTLTAQWLLPEAPVTYKLTVTDGTAWVNGEQVTEAAKGDIVTIEASETALEGMAFERWEVRKGEVKLENDRAAETTFTMPAGEVQLEAMYQTKAAEVHDSGWDAATVVTGVAVGTGTAILAYHIGMEVYAEQVLGKDVAVPRTRAEVALLAWQLAGSPAVNVEGEPLSEAAQAEKWAVESGLMQPDAEGNFNGTKKMSKWNALRTLDAAKKMG